MGEEDGLGAQLFLLGECGVAHGVPALAELVPVKLDVVAPVVGGADGEVAEERLAAGDRLLLADESDHRCR